MKVLIREIEGDGYYPIKRRHLSFKEFCQLVYETPPPGKKPKLVHRQLKEFDSIFDDGLLNIDD